MSNINYSTLNYPARTSGIDDNTVTAFWTGLGLLIVAVLLTFVIAAIVMSSQGRNPSAHPSAIPAGVTRLDSNDYLIYNHRYGPYDICWDTDGQGQRTNTVVAVPSLRDASFVQCSVSQTWNDHTPNGASFFAEWPRIAMSRSFEIVAAIALLLALSPAAVMALRDSRKNRRNRKLVLADVEDIRREVRVAFAKGEIEESEMENALNRIYNIKGIKREKDAALPKELRL